MGDGTNKGLLPLLASAVITFYDGSQPASPDAAVGSVNNYGSCTFPSPAGTVSNGTLTLGTVPNGTVAYGTGVTAPTWFRIATPGGAPLWDGSCGNSSSYDCNVGPASNWILNVPLTGLSGTTLAIPAH
jgi:hypothetical protein